MSTADCRLARDTLVERARKREANVGLKLSYMYEAHDVVFDVHGRAEPHRSPHVSDCSSTDLRSRFDWSEEASITCPAGVL